MKIIGFSFTKLNAEKAEKASTQNLNIKSNIDISDIYEVKSDFLNSKDTLVGVKFNYSISYEPEYAKIYFEGAVIFSVTQEEAKEILNSWKDKKVNELFKVPLFNTILKKSNIKALHLEEELNLPTHIPMPSVKAEKTGN